MTYPVYPEYKDSGVEWLGDIPEQWVVRRLKFACKQVTKKVATNGRAVIALENIEGFTGKYIETDQEYSGEDVGFIAGDIIFGKLRPYLAKVYLAKDYGVAFGDLLVYRPSNDVLSDYAFNQMISDGFISEVDSSTYGSKMPRASVEFINDMPFLIPTNEEQKQIATFLDRETQKIDCLIEKQQQLIKLLQEKRQAVISHAVTKGLNPNAKMKDSGVEWLGEIPEHWDIKKIGYIAFLKSGDAIVSEQISETGEYPVYGGNGLRGYFGNFNHEGDYVLIGRQGALCGNINYGHGKFWASEHAIVVYPVSTVDYKWIGETLKAMNLNQYSVSAAQPGLAVGNITCLKVPFPSKQEQTQISTYIDRETKKIDRLIEKCNEAISLSKERRTALISAAVTGKIDVRETVNG